MKEKLLAYYEKAKTIYNQWKEATLKLLDELKKFSFWKWYLIVFWVIFNIALFVFIYAIFSSKQVYWSLFAIPFLLGVLLIIAAPIIFLGMKINERDKKDRAEKQAKKDKELQDLQLNIRQSLSEGRYPGMKVDIFLPEDEFCIMVFWVAVYKTKTRTKNIYYSWLRYRVRIAKGLSYTVWNVNPARETISYKYLDDKGILYLTNKRIIVKLEKKVESIPYEKLLYCELIPGWVILYKNTGSPLNYQFVWDYEKFPIYLSEILNAQKDKPKKKSRSKKVEEVEVIEDPKPWKTEVLKIEI